MCKFLSGVFFLWTISSSGAAQPGTVLFETFTSGQGLPNDKFTYTIQDMQGLIWMAGLDGLASYDGHSFKTYRHGNADSTAISANSVSTIFEDSKCRLWVCSVGYGIDISNGTKTKFYPLKISGNAARLNSAVVSDIGEDQLGRYWLASNEGLFILRDEDSLMVDAGLIDLEMHPELNKPTAFFDDGASEMWVGTQTGLYIYNYSDSTLTLPEAITGLPARGIHEIRRDREGKIWVACQHANSRMYYTDPDQVVFKPLPALPFESESRTLRFTFDLDNRLWVAIFGEQVYGYDFRDSSVFLISSINSNIAHERFLRNPFVDHAGNVWLHGDGYLIHRFPKGFFNYQHPFAFHQSNTCIYGFDGQMWLGYREKGFILLNDQMQKPIHYSSENPQSWIPENHIQAFLQTRSGHTVVVGFSKLTVLDRHNDIIASYETAGSNRAAYEDSKGRIWIGGFSGLILFSETAGIEKIYRLPVRLGDNRNFIQGIVEDHDGYIWFASDLKGLARLDPGSGTIRQFLPGQGDKNALPTANVLDITRDEQNMLWLATDVALIRFDPVTFEFYVLNTSDGLRNDYILSVVCDKGGKIWMSTNSGISSFDPVTETFVNYDLADGLLNTGYYTRSAFCAEDGTLYFGGKSGIDYFHPRDLRTNPAAPMMYLSQVTVNNEIRDLSGQPGQLPVLNLTQKDKLFEISFVGLHYASPEFVRYAYRIDGLHEEWIELGTKHQVLFSGLPPGDYVFKAMAVSDDGVVSEDELQLGIHVNPPLHETLWFRALAICLLAAGLFGFVRYRERRIQMKDKKEAQVEQQIRDLERRALQAQMNPHFIYNCMNSIQQFMILHDYEGAMKYLTRFSRLLRMVLNTSAQQRVSLSDELKLLEDYVELENMRFPNKFSYEIVVSPELNVHTVEIPPFLIQPQIENAIRHGLMHRTTSGHLSIHIGKNDQRIKVVVEDNGVGRNKSNGQKKHAFGEGKGLSIVQERLAYLETGNGQQSLNIIDLFDANGNPAGTRVEITLPLE